MASTSGKFLSTPLEQIEYTKEYEHILNIAEINDFDKQLIDKKVHKIEAHQRNPPYYQL